MACISWRNRVLAALLLFPVPALAQDAMAVRTPVLATLDKAPADLSAVTLSVVALLRGMGDPAGLRPVEFAPGVAEKLRDPQTRFTGFDLEGFGIAYLGPSASGKPGRRMVGTLVFVDGAGRRAETAYALDYTFAAGGVQVQEAALRRQTPQVPRIRLQVLRADRLPMDFFARPPGEMSALLGTLPTEQELPRGLSGPFYVIAQNLDRLAGTDRLVFEAETLLPQSLVDMGGWQLLASRHDELPESPLEIRVGLQRGNRGHVQPLGTLRLPGR